MLQTTLNSGISTWHHLAPVNPQDALAAVGVACSIQFLRILPSAKLALISMAGHKYRGWNIAEAAGLTLMRVDYPPHDNLTALMHPERVAAQQQAAHAWPRVMT